jgi:long-chain acyl-CoA synthetase
VSVALSERPWHALYGDRPRELPLPHVDVLAMARATLAASADRPLVHYFDASLTGAELDAESDALACALADRGFGAGDRLVVQLQNMPQMVVGLLAAWKLGGIAVPTNPMYRERELGLVVRDCGARALLTLEELWEPVARPAIAGTDVVHAITTCGLDHLGDTRPPVLAGVARVSCAGADDLAALIEAHRGQRPPDVAREREAPVLLVYTSGTTGPPKGTMISHRNVVADAVLWREWIDLSPEDPIMGIAPLFHITGLAANLGVSLFTGAPLILGYRFDPAGTLRLIERHRAAFVVGAITAFTAMMNDPSFSADPVSSLRVTLSGGAPVAPAIIERWREVTGAYVQNCYGLTETTSLTHLVPSGLEAPVDATSGTLSIGIPVSGVDVEVHGDDGRPLPPGEVGELVIAGPQVTSGYWNNPEETRHALPDGRLRTGDVGFMDEEGWFYLVDRRKDLIIASGYKVWPREVEDVLVQHPAVREAAVVGEPDEYRGETVKAFVSLRAGRSATSDELVAFCREQLAAYKYPRAIEFLDDLPKTLTGKILRRELRRTGPSA